jgi:hypothetical protein
LKTFDDWNSGDPTGAVDKSPLASESSEAMIEGPDLKLVDTGAENTPFSKFTTSMGLMSAGGSN